MPAAGLHGAHTERALENFPLAGEPVHRELVVAGLDRFQAFCLFARLNNDQRR